MPDVDPAFRAGRERDRDPSIIRAFVIVGVGDLGIGERVEDAVDRRSRGVRHEREVGLDSAGRDGCGGRVLRAW